MDPSEPVSVDLEPAERDVLARGLDEWGGPARCTEALAIAMGFEGLDGFLDHCQRLSDAISAGQPLSRRDWRRALLATEIVFASDVVGSGHDWSSTVGLTDGETIHLLRSIQRKITR